VCCGIDSQYNLAERETPNLLKRGRQWRISISNGLIELSGLRGGLLTLRACSSPYYPLSALTFTLPLKETLATIGVITLVVFAINIIRAPKQLAQEQSDTASGQLSSCEQESTKDLSLATALQTELNNLTRPEFVLALGQGGYTFVPDHNETLLFIQARLVNHGASSAPMDWSAHYRSKTLDTNLRFLRPIPPLLLFHPVGESFSIKFDASKEINVKTGAIERGTYIEGPLLMTIPGNKIAELDHSDAIVTITVHDYLEQSYSNGWESSGVRALYDIPPEEQIVPVPKKGRAKKHIAHSGNSN
jgi:hypothetical protein